MMVIHKDKDISTDLLSLESSLFEAIEDNNQERILQLLDKMIKASVENTMLSQWLENLLKDHSIEIGEDLHSWMELRFEYWQEMAD